MQEFFDNVNFVIKVFATIFDHHKNVILGLDLLDHDGKVEATNTSPIFNVTKFDWDEH
jgi:hypothetical protein